MMKTSKFVLYSARWMRKNEYKLLCCKLLCFGLSMQKHNMVQKTTTEMLPKAHNITCIQSKP